MYARVQASSHNVRLALLESIVNVGARREKVVLWIDLLVCVYVCVCLRAYAHVSVCASTRD